MGLLSAFENPKRPYFKEINFKSVVESRVVYMTCSFNNVTVLLKWRHSQSGFDSSRQITAVEHCCSIRFQTRNRRTFTCCSASWGFLQKFVSAFCNAILNIKEALCTYTLVCLYVSPPVKLCVSSISVASLKLEFFIYWLNKARKNDCTPKNRGKFKEK
jgi:hypothetical protein